MSLAIDLGAHFCRAAYVADDTLPRLIDLSALGPSDAASAGDRSAVRPLPTFARRAGSQVHLGESAVATWRDDSESRYVSAPLATLMGTASNTNMELDAFVHYLARRAAGATRRQFQASASNVWFTSRLPLEQQRIERACRLAGMSCHWMSIDDAVAAHLDLAASQRMLLINWSASGFDMTVVGANDPAVVPLRIESLSGAALLGHAFESLRSAETTNAAIRATRTRALQRLVYESCSSPVSLLAYEDSVTLIGDRTDLVPIAGIRRMLCAELRRRFELHREHISAWLASLGASLNCILIGGMAKNSGLVGELVSLLEPIGIRPTIQRNPDNIVVNGLALLSRRTRPVAAMNRLLPCDVGIKREKSGVQSYMIILQRGATLPAEWTIQLPVGDRKGLKVLLATDPKTEQPTEIGGIELGESELAASKGETLVTTVRVHLDLWIELRVETGDKSVVSRDWLPLVRVQCDRPFAAPSIVEHIVD